MQPRRGARVGRAATGGAPSWLQSNWSLGRFAGGPGGGQVRPPSVIRVGQAFQAVVPPWRGPVSLDGAEAETTQHRTPASGAKTRDASPAPPSGAKKSARVEARAEREAEAEREALERRERALTARGRTPAESEPERAARLGGFKVFPPEGGAASTRVHTGAGAASKKRADAEQPGAADRRTTNEGLGFSAANARILKRPRTGAEPPSNEAGSPEGGKGGRGGKEGGKDSSPNANASLGASSGVVPPRSPSTVDDAYAAALALIPVNPSVRAAAQARLKAAARRAMEASKRAAGGAFEDSRAFEDSLAKPPSGEDSDAKEGKNPEKAREEPAAPDANGAPSNDGANGRTAGAESDAPDSDAAPPASVAAARPSAAAVASARAALEASLRAARSSPAVMGLASMGRASAEARGWTAASSAAFERRLKAHKFNVFAISRLGTGRKKPLDPPKDSGPGAANDADATDAGAEGPGGIAVAPLEASDPALSGRTMLDMVDYYYNAWLTRADAEDDDGDRSDRGEEEAEVALARPSANAAKEKPRANAAKEKPPASLPPARSASERELARLGHDPSAEAERRKRERRARKERKAREARERKEKSERGEGVPPLALEKKAADARGPRVATAAQASGKVRDMLAWLRGAAGGNVRAAAGVLKRAPFALDEKALMMSRWRRAWLDGALGAPERRETARKEGRRVREAFLELAKRPRKYPQHPAAEIAFSSDDEE